MGRTEKMEKANKYLESIAKETPTCATGFSVYASYRGFKDLPWKTHLLGFVQYLYWATAEKMNISFQGIWTEVMSWETHMHICPPKLDISWERTLSLCVVSRRWKDAVSLECWFFFFLVISGVNICLREKWLTESWGPYQLDQFGLGKVYIFPKKCVFVEEMCFWIPGVSLNKNSKKNIS